MKARTAVCNMVPYQLLSRRQRLVRERTEPLRQLNPHLLLVKTLMAIEMPKISLVSQPFGRFTDCNK